MTTADETTIRNASGPCHLMIAWRAIRHLLFFSMLGKRLNTRSAIINNLCFTGFNTVTKAYIAWCRLIRGTHTDAAPFKIIYVDPAAIQRISGLDHGYSGEVRSGSWDQSEMRFIQDNPVAKAIKLHFESGVAWTETPLYEEFHRELKTRGNAWGYESMNDFEARCSDLEALYARIRDDGYCTQRELYNSESSRVRSKNNDSIHPFMHEINIDIGRSGELLWRRIGQNRLAIAKVLDLDSIPVRPVVRHADWQQMRDRIRSDKADPIDHPDLVDLC